MSCSAQPFVCMINYRFLSSGWALGSPRQHWLNQLKRANAARLKLSVNSTTPPGCWKHSSLALQVLLGNRNLHLCPVSPNYRYARTRMPIFARRIFVASMYQCTLASAGLYWWNALCSCSQNWVGVQASSSDASTRRSVFDGSSEISSSSMWWCTRMLFQIKKPLSLHCTQNLSAHCEPSAKTS